MEGSWQKAREELEEARNKLGSEDLTQLVSLDGGRGEGWKVRGDAGARGTELLTWAHERCRQHSAG